jgi:hypothetical protein
LSVSEFMAYGLSASWLLYSRLDRTYKSILTHNSLTYKTFGFIYFATGRKWWEKRRKIPRYDQSGSLPSRCLAKAISCSYSIPASASWGGEHTDWKVTSYVSFLCFQNEESRLKTSLLQHVYTVMKFVILNDDGGKFQIAKPLGKNHSRNCLNPSTQKILFFGIKIWRSLGHNGTC